MNNIFINILIGNLYKHLFISSKMEPEILFLGTGSATPTAKRNHVGILISWGPERILVDCGEGIQRQFRIAGKNLCKLTRILITHWHADHTIGLPGLLETLNMNGYSKKLNIYGPRGTKHKLELFEKIYGNFKINPEVYEISGKFIDEKDFTLEASPMEHGPPTNAYSFTIKDKLRLDKKKIEKLKIPNSPILGKLQQGKDAIHPETKKKIRAKEVTYPQKGKKITVILDTRLNKNAVKIAKDSDALICEASFTSENKEKAEQYNHLTAEQAATIAKKAKVKKLILIHLSQRHGLNVKPVLREAKKIFKNTVVANDLDVLKI